MTTLVTDHLRDFIVEHPHVEQTTGDFSIVRVRSRHEKVFVRELRAEAIGYYLPLRLHKRYWRGQRREAWVPMFQGLVFVANGQDGRSVASGSRCVTGYIPVAPSYQPQLRRELIQLETVLSNEPESDTHPDLIPGRPVQVRQGIDHWARGLRGKVVRRQNREMFCIEVEFMGRIVPVEDVDPVLLEVIEDAA
jgi:hypothetical protein